MTYRSSLLGGAAFAAAATLGGVYVRRAEPATASRVAVFTYAPDSTPLFGPKRFNAPGSGSTIYTERFLAVAGSAYMLKVENGAPDGTGRVSTGTVRINSAAILSPSDFAGAPALLTRFVQLTSSDTLKVELSAGSGQFVTASVLAAPNPRFPVHGPTLVTVQSGTQVTVDDNFTLPAGTSGPFRVHVVNGPDGTTRVSNATVTLNGTDVLNQNDINANIAAVERAVTLTSSNTVAIKVKQSSVGNRLSIRFTATDTTKPTITLTAPAQNALTGNTSIGVSGSIDDKTVTAVTVNGASAPLDANGAFSVSAPLGNEGQNTLTITAIDANGNRSDSTRTVTRDTQAPSFDVFHPAPNEVTQSSSAFTRGPVSDLTAVTVTANGAPQALTGDGFFQDAVALVAGPNQITFVATDVLGHSSTVVRTVIRDNTAPSLSVSAPSDNSTTLASSVAVTGIATDATALGVTVNGEPVSLNGAGAFSTDVALSEGANVVTVVATDEAGNSSTVVRNVTRQSEPLPPDPVSVAPPLDRTVATNMAAATEFLYTGANPIQTGVSAGTIDPKRVVVLKGTVRKSDDSALSGVEITVLDHAELGRTLSRADGAFDMAVNGGGIVTLEYKRAGYAPVQRQAATEWQTYRVLDNVVMTPLDTAVTTIEFSNPIEVHRATPVTDADGTRRATLLFQQGTQVTMVKADGSTESLPSISVRATEYTVGESGPQAMPASLPGTSGYTYAVELSVDEALALDAKEVRFSKPVAVYAENFLQFPVGLRVPVAFYNRTRASWVPEADGKVIKIVGASGGLATISTDTLGTVADSVTLATLGITTAERQTLAATYSVGQSLWRMPVMHFSPMDGNYPSGPPAGAKPPHLDIPDLKDLCDLLVEASIIECTTQVLGEQIDVTGAPFRLTYRSNRTRGYQTAYQQRIRLTDSTFAPNLVRVELEVEVAGRRFTQSFQPAPNLTTLFSWDGKDAYGRRVQGQQAMTVRVGYVYPMLYNVPPAEAASFGLTCYGSGSEPWGTACVIPRGPGDIGLRARTETTLWQQQDLTIGQFDSEALKNGTWSVDIHHVFDPVARTLYLGDGRRRTAEDVLTTVAGRGAIGTAGNGIPATEAYLADPEGVAVGPDGSVYILDWSFQVRKVAPNGTITTIAGTGVQGNSGDGGPALLAQIDVGRIAFGPDGSLYLAQRSRGVIRRITPDGIIRRFAGGVADGCENDPSPNVEDRNTCREGVPALATSIDGPYAIAVGPDGSVYFGDGNYAIRKVSPNGIVTSIAGGGYGGGEFCDYRNPFPWPAGCGDGGAARHAGLDIPFGLAVGPDGAVYFTDVGTEAVRRIGPDGILTRFAGDGTGISEPRSNASGPATSVRIRPEDLAFGPDGSLYVAEYNRIRRISNGIITTVAGGSPLPLACGAANQPLCRTGDPALGTPFWITHNGGIAVSPDGSVYFGTFQGDNRIRRLVPFFAPFSGNAIRIASENGREVFEFDASGRHLRTRHAVTGNTIYTFGYDPSAQLASITDGDNNITTFERNGTGVLTAVVSPFGQRTMLSPDERGYLSSVTNPAGETVTVQHDTLGLLISLRDAKNNPAQQFRYDSVGLLVRDSAGSGASYTLARAETDTSVVVTLTSALGQTRTFTRFVKQDGTVRRSETDQAGLASHDEERRDGTSVTTTQSGVVFALTRRADPRFGMEAPKLAELNITMPSGLGLIATTKTTVTLSNSADVMSLTALLDSVTLNGRTFQRMFNGAARTVTETTSEGRQSVAQLDTLGRVVEERLTGIAPVRYSYGSRGFLTTISQAGRTAQYDYDSVGRLTRVTDPIGRFTQYARDSIGRVTTQTFFNGNQILYGYDANGNLNSITPPGRPAHTLMYTVDNVDSAYTPPAAGLPNPATRYTFNLDRQLTQVLRPDGLTIGVNYDAAARPNTLTLPNGQMQITYSPTSGNVATLTSADGGTLTYADDGILRTDIAWTGTIQGSVGFKYDNSFRLTKIAVNETDSVTLSYDRDDRLTSAGAMALTRDPQNGRLVRTVVASDTSAWSYDDSTGAVTRYRATHGPATLFDAIYTRDSLDRIKQIVETVEGATKTKTFTYDSLGRLDQVRLDGALVSDYAYDAIGNRLNLTTQAGTVSGTYDDQDRMLTYGAATYSYTANGDLNMKVVGTDTTRYSYDVLGNLLQVRLPNGTVVDYIVDAENRRIGKKVNGAIVQGFLYQGKLAPAVELNDAGQVVSRFVYGSRPNVPDYIVRRGVTYRLVLDHVGSVRLAVNTASGAIAQRIDYDEFGRVTLNTSPGFQPFGYAGGLTDDLTLLVRYGARDYQPDVGRWTAKDPILFSGGEASLYVYSDGDPINLSDPTGLSPACYLDMALNFGLDKVAIRPLRLLQKILPFVPGDINLFQWLEGEVSSPISWGPVDFSGWAARMGGLGSQKRYDDLGGDRRYKTANDRFARTSDGDLGREIGRLDDWRTMRNVFKKAADVIGVIDLATTFLTCRCKDLGYIKNDGYAAPR